MNRSADPTPVDTEKLLGLREKPGQPPYSSPHAPRGPSPQADQQNAPFDSYEGAALKRARSRAPSISPWLFVMATALNTMVASILAVIITLGVVRQERSDVRSDVQPRDPALAPAYARPAVVARTETAAPNVALQQISLRPIGSPNQPLRLEPQKPAQLSLQIRARRSCKRTVYSRPLRRSARNNLVRRDPDQLRHLVLVPWFGRAARNRFA
jgi:hypothetical protein